MPRLSPFRALRYTAEAGDPADLIAPPYDVIDARAAAELRDRGPYNSVRLVLPEGEGDERYALAAKRLAAWRDTGALRADDRPGVYVYRQRYRRGQRAVERHALFAALELEPLGDGVLPHERTHAAPKADRLALTLATRAQLSPVFLLARDPEASLLTALQASTAAAPALEATTPDGITHGIWPIAEEGAAAVLCALAGRLPLLIADGHHRYETAQEVARRLGTEASRHVLACVVSASDPGLTVLPTHRTLTDLSGISHAGLRGAPALRAGLEVSFRAERLGTLRPADAASDPAGFVCVLGGERDALRLAPRQSPARAEDAIAAVQFDRHVIQGLLATDADTAAHAGLLEYHRDAADAIARARPGGAAFLLPPVGLAAVWQATADGVRLPPKSTYFEPKIPSGLLFRTL